MDFSQRLRTSVAGLAGSLFVPGEESNGLLQAGKGTRTTTSHSVRGDVHVRRRRQTAVSSKSRRGVAKCSAQQDHERRELQDLDFEIRWSASRDLLRESSATKGEDLHSYVDQEVLEKAWDLTASAKAKERLRLFERHMSKQSDRSEVRQGSSQEHEPSLAATIPAQRALPQLGQMSLANSWLDSRNASLMQPMVQQQRLQTEPELPQELVKEQPAPRHVHEREEPGMKCPYPSCNHRITSEEGLPSLEWLHFEALAL